MTRKQSHIAAYLCATTGMCIMTWFFLVHAPCALCYGLIGVSWIAHISAGFQMRKNEGYFEAPVLATANNSPCTRTRAEQQEIVAAYYRELEYNARKRLGK